MKIKEGFALKKIAGNWVVLPLAEKTLDFTGMLTLNDSGQMLWQLLVNGCTRTELAESLVNEYEVTYDEALADVDEYLQMLSRAGCLDA
jgi:hypothetical protein